MIGRIQGVLLQEYYITKRSLEVIMDLFFFSIVNIVAFGFVSRFLFSGNNTLAGEYLLSGLIFWEVIRVNQYSMSVGALWNVWSKNLSNMFISPMSLTEYFVAHMLSGIVKSLLIFFIVSVVSVLFFDFNISKIGYPTLVASFLNLTIFSWAVGIIILGMIFRYGTRIQALAWGLVFLFQPLTAALFPLRILPDFMKIIAYFFPSTYVFEAIRNSLTTSSFDLQFQAFAFLENIFYFGLSLWVFNLLFERSKETGQFANNES